MVMKRKATNAMRQGRGGRKPQGSNKRKALGGDAFNWSKTSKHEDAIASDSEHDGDSDDEHQEHADDNNEDEDEEDAFAKETAGETRVRLAKEYLNKLTTQEQEQEHGNEDEMVDGVEARVSARLQQDAMEALGKLFKPIAGKLEGFEFGPESTRSLPGHKLTPTSVCLSDDGKTAFSGSKDGAVLRWDLVTRTKTRLQLPTDDVSKATTDQERCVRAVAVSSDGKFLATGGNDTLLRVWDAEKGVVLETFQGHRDAISSLVFRPRTHMLFSGSLDRSIKHWNLTEMGYIETLFGHQGDVNALDALYKERVVSCGRDRSVRFWKIPEETHLVFYGNSGSMDCVKMVTDEYYVTGGDDGAVSLWFNGRKKPVHVVANAHQGKWISSVAVMPRSDLVASGSSDGRIRLWRADLSARKLIQVAEIPQLGFVNSLCFDAQGRFLLAAVGQEHRLGRWERIKGVKNGLVMIALPSAEDLELESSEQETSDDAASDSDADEQSEREQLEQEEQQEEEEEETNDAVKASGEEHDEQA